ncbi:hypothetical protein ATANTOWER_013306 [Ataeniobius toweri]|uniref:Uncharacterized protein n=1 Tax=Ataeniobius toweri TaxID=208326 RepID=A0ABU7C7Z6_9TELE|nr:hypothetical protein [Ataeniobius toweri]
MRSADPELIRPPGVNSLLVPFRVFDTFRLTRIETFPNRDSERIRPRALLVLAWFTVWFESPTKAAEKQHQNLTCKHLRLICSHGKKKAHPVLIVEFYVFRI